MGHALLLAFPDQADNGIDEVARARFGLDQINAAAEETAAKMPSSPETPLGTRSSFGAFTWSSMSLIRLFRRIRIGCRQCEVEGASFSH
jgi:hypothetical protein